VKAEVLWRKNCTRHNSILLSLDIRFNQRYCCTVHFEDALSITHQRMHKFYIILKFITLKHLKFSYMFRSLDHPQGVCIVPC